MGPLNIPPMEKPLDALIIAPHPDDAELGMGGTIIKMIQAGMHVGVLDLTNGEPTPHGSVEIREKETAVATQHLGVQWRFNAGMRNRFLEPTLENRATLANIFRAVRPKWLFAPYWEDAHPDHTAATQLIEAARFWSKLTKSDLQGTPYHPQRVFYYYCVHLRLAIQPAFVVDISDHWPSKKLALQAYHSQLVMGRSSEWPTFIDRVEHENLNWGRLIGTLYGEPFHSREPIGIGSMSGLI